jgi:hypothetical protein
VDLSLVVSSFRDLLLNFLPVFNVPSQSTFLTLAASWAMTVGPRTVTNLIRTAGGEAVKSHDAYQYFFSRARWAMDELWHRLFLIIVSTLVPDGVIRLAGDDTLLHHGGRHIFGVGAFRDAVRSTKKRVAYSFGHNWVLLCVVVRLPLLTETYLALPVLARLRPKAKKCGKGKGTDPTTVDLMAEMLGTVARWAPQRHLEFLGDGAYACLAGRLPENVRIVSRLRKDAALYAPALPRKTGQVGRPRTKGKRLPTPEKIANSARAVWQETTLKLYGKEVSRLLSSFTAIWYEVLPDRPIKVVCVRDPAGEASDEFFFSTDLDLEDNEIVLAYAARWSIEVTNRNSKQFIGIEGPQARCEPAVRRQASFGWWIMSLVMVWYLTKGYDLSREHGMPEPWYEHKEGVSFADMLAVLRRASWRHWINHRSGLEPRHAEILKPLIWCASRAG